METQCVRIPLRRGETERFLSFIRAAQARKAEMLESMQAEGVVFECIFLERQAEQDSIIFYMQAENLEKAQRAFAESRLPIDVETRAMIAACWDVERTSLLQPCLELAVPDGS